MNATTARAAAYPAKEPRGPSERVSRLRAHYFKGTDRAWNNACMSWTTGTPWDVRFQESTYRIVPETYLPPRTLRGAYRHAAHVIGKCTALYEKSESVSTRVFPAPDPSCLVKGCAQEGKTQKSRKRAALGWMQGKRS